MFIVSISTILKTYTINDVVLNIETCNEHAVVIWERGLIDSQSLAESVKLDTSMLADCLTGLDLDDWANARWDVLNIGAGSM